MSPASRRAPSSGNDGARRALVGNPLAENNTIPTKIKKTLEEIRLVKDVIRSWRSLSDQEMSTAVAKYDRAVRAESSQYYRELFEDGEFARLLLSIQKARPNDDKLTMLVISAIGNMLQRYGLQETPEIYDLMLSNARRNNVGPYVAIFLPRMRTFMASEENKWDYFMEIKSLSPKKVAERSFEVVLDLYGDDIPEQYRGAVVQYLEKKMQSANNEYGRRYYADFRNKVRQNN
ncbi:hypothetical protein P3H80_08220 [Mycolicibacterium septicum]|uniref:hypothetical protein n=1 Tax=Mycolicibacterium septicum TaxID=98668 RepID=UPI0023E18893|nr:hypothetical protein [Mycolicibacterium septicum]MDF3337402.1 hypothetical protein [Mycolicibacterium septicum]